jgi:hypothetical protein
MFLKLPPTPPWKKFSSTARISAVTSQPKRSVDFIVTLLPAVCESFWADDDTTFFQSFRLRFGRFTGLTQLLVC